jgi:hypothetical protein
MTEPRAPLSETPTSVLDSHSPKEPFPTPPDIDPHTPPEASVIGKIPLITLPPSPHGVTVSKPDPVRIPDTHDLEHAPPREAVEGDVVEPDGSVAVEAEEVAEEDIIHFLAPINCEDMRAFVNPLHVGMITETPCEGGKPVIEIHTEMGCLNVAEPLDSVHQKLAQALADWTAVAALSSHQVMLAAQQDMMRAKYAAAAAAQKGGE